MYSPNIRAFAEGSRRFEPVFPVLPAAPDADVFGGEVGDAAMQAEFVVGDSPTLRSPAVVISPACQLRSQPLPAGS